MFTFITLYFRLEIFASISSKESKQIGMKFRLVNENTTNETISSNKQKIGQTTLLLSQHGK